MNSDEGRPDAVLLGVFPLVALGLVNGLWVESIFDTYPGAFWVVDISQNVLVPLACAYALSRFGNVKPASYGFGRPSRALDAPIWFQFVLAAIVLVVVYDQTSRLAYNYLGQYAASFGYGTALPSDQPIRSFALIYFAVTTGLIEEAVFRGLPWLYCATRLKGRAWLPGYVLVTSMLFAAVHWEQGPHGMYSTLAFGLTAAMLYAWFQNLWPLVVGHALVVIWALT